MVPHRCHSRAVARQAAACGYRGTMASVHSVYESVLDLRACTRIGACMAVRFLPRAAVAIVAPIAAAAAFAPALSAAAETASARALEESPTPRAKPARPNIVFMLADDLGWRDLACTGHPVHRTPNLDRLRRQGMAFLDANASAPICSASRASLLTGRSPARLHYEFVPKNEAGRQSDAFPLRTPDYPTELVLGTPTVGSVLREAGYETAFFGKWHLNRHHGSYLSWSPTHGPAAFGFDVAQTDFGSHPYGYPNRKAPPPAMPAGAFPDDALTQLAVDYLRRPHAKPFLMWLAFYYVHDPFHSRAAWLVDDYGRRLPPTASQQRRHYAAMVETLDRQVGRVLDALDAAGLTDNTLVIFTSDNGGHPQVSANGPLRGSKWNLYQGGLRVPLLARWPGRVEAGGTCAVPVLGSDLFPTLAEVAGVQGDAGKAPDGLSFAGLLRERRPGGDDRRPESGSAQTRTTTRDAGGAHAASFAARPGGAMLWHFPYYHPEEKLEAAKPTIGIEDYVARHQVRPHSALRVGDDKLLWFAETDAVELYDLAADPGEQKDLSAAQPDKATRLRERLLEALRASGARFAQPRR